MNNFFPGRQSRAIWFGVPALAGCTKRGQRLAEPAKAGTPNPPHTLSVAIRPTEPHASPDREIQSHTCASVRLDSGDARCAPGFARHFGASALPRTTSRRGCRILSRAVLTFLLACISARAAEVVSPDSVPRLTLEQALALAEQHHPDLAEARALADAAEGRARQAGAFPNPEAVARVESAPINGRTTGEAEYLAGLAQTIPLGSRLSRARQAEQLDRQRLLLDAEAKLRAVRRRVHNAFATALYQEQASSAQSKLTASANELVAVTKARLQAGDVTADELARAEMEFSRARLEHQRAIALHFQSLTSLAGAIGRPALRVASITGSLETAFDVPALEAIAADLDRHPAIASADAAVTAQSARVDLAKAERIPDINVELLYRRVEADKANTFDFGLR
ncbi:MAG: TolC family protein, partial [Verrucomicrobia bacterium]|nr:TolC family protein [Verrucomicrobiota bacterium]